jgi:DNA-binding MarR family transcriptional regulator
MKSLLWAIEASVDMSRELPDDMVDDVVVDAVLTASRTLVAVAEQSLGAAADETTLAQYRALVVLASRGPQRQVDLARALGVTPPTAGRMCDRLVRKGLIRRHRARSDRREVQVSITTAGRQVVDQATARRRDLIAEILGRIPARRQAVVAAAFQLFAAAAGEVPDSQWPEQAAATDAADEPKASTGGRARRADAAASATGPAASATGPA